MEEIQSVGESGLGKNRRRVIGENEGRVLKKYFTYSWVGRGGQCNFE